MWWPLFGALAIAVGWALLKEANAADRTKAIGLLIFVFGFLMISPLLWSITSGIWGIAFPSDQAATTDLAPSPDPDYTKAPHEHNPPLSPAVARKIKILQAEAESLYERAAWITSHAPTNSMNAAIMVSGSDGPAGRFYDRDLKLQTTLRTLPRTFNVMAAANLGTAEEFMYQAVVASVAACNEHDASLNLSVARADLDEVKRDVAGDAWDDWEDLDITDQVNGEMRCSQ